MRDGYSGRPVKKRFKRGVINAAGRSNSGDIDSRTEKEYSFIPKPTSTNLRICYTLRQKMGIPSNTMA